jgi:hypothetical protein
LNRTAFALLALILAAGATGGEAKADPYRWCADYGGGCVPNPFFDGRPVVTPEDGVRVKRRARHS